MVRYCGWAFLPLLLFVALFFAAIGLEELFELALIDERAALWVVPVVAIATLGAITFAIRASFMRKLRAGAIASRSRAGARLTGSHENCR